jgi:hypothetical protein
MHVKVRNYKNMHVKVRNWGGMPPPPQYSKITKGRTQFETVSKVGPGFLL